MVVAKSYHQHKLSVASYNTVCVHNMDVFWDFNLIYFNIKHEMHLGTFIKDVVAVVNTELNNDEGK